MGCLKSLTKALIRGLAGKWVTLTLALMSCGGSAVALAKAPNGCLISLATQISGLDSQEEVQSFYLQSDKFPYGRRGVDWKHHHLEAEVRYFPARGQMNVRVELKSPNRKTGEKLVLIQHAGVFLVPEEGQPGAETPSPEGVVVAHRDPSTLGSQWAALFTGEAFRREVSLGAIPLLTDSDPYDILLCPKPGEDMSGVRGALLTLAYEARTRYQRWVLICF